MIIYLYNDITSLVIMDKIKMMRIETHSPVVIYSFLVHCHAGCLITFVLVLGKK